MKHLLPPVTYYKANLHTHSTVSDGKLTGIFAPDASDAEYGLAMSGVTKGGKA